MILTIKNNQLSLGFAIWLAFWTPFAVFSQQPDIGLHQDLAAAEVTGEFKPGSHIKLYLPNLPYLAISHAVNGALLRPSDVARGWEYDLAVSHSSIDDLIWEFELRNDAYFHDGSHFNADSVLANVAAFQKQPFTFSSFASKLSHVEKIDDYRVRFYMHEPYGAFPYDAIWLQFYTYDYLNKFGWNGKPTCPNLAESGPYGLGPYILSKGYVEGDRSSKSVELIANQNYWGEQKPKVEKITINFEISSEQAYQAVTEQEGQIDLMSVDFSNQVGVVLSAHAKLASVPSQNNYAMHMNLISGDPALNDPNIRRVINRAIDQEYLLNLSMLGEGMLSPTMVSPNFYRIDEALNSLSYYLTQSEQSQDHSIQAMQAVVANYQRANGIDPKQKLQLKVLAQESFLFLIKDLKHFLEQVNIELIPMIVPTEKQVFEQLLVTWEKKNTKDWDLLLWGNTDWYKHPWSAFFVYLPAYAWSTIPQNPELLEMLEALFRSNIDSDEYIQVTADIIRYVHQHNLMVFLPTPNNVFALNKEVVFTPSSSAFVYLRDIEVSDFHWSLRAQEKLPEERLLPIEINHNHDEIR